MSRKRQFTQTMEVTSRQRHSGIRQCGQCHRDLGKKEKFTIITTQNDWFRGDDDVEVKCQNGN